jgi:hypothetical protein
MWKEGDECWCLWIDGASRRYVAHCEGVVCDVDGPFLRLTGGGWRRVDEGLAFKSRGQALRYAADHPVVFESPTPGASATCPSPEAMARSRLVK